MTSLPRAGKTELDRLLAGSPYQGYAYAYPHKSAYRRLDPPRRLRTLWEEEERDALFLYMHVPFCEFRCGFCNLFTQANPAEGLMERFVAQLEREAKAAQEALGSAGFARLAFGGGTPTQLPLALLTRLFDLAERLGADSRAIPAAIETSPDTVSSETLALLRERGVDRVSMGVQSFLEEEARAAGRPQRTAQVHRALALLREAGFPRLNLDLIYGLPGQTRATWLRSLEGALEYRPEELFLYPLYVRPLTGLGRTQGPTRSDTLRLELYRAGRERLLAAGYRQVSMRFFTREGLPEQRAPAYSCQEDGMLGLGCGARSYTRSLHYSQEYAVSSRGVKQILASYLEREPARFEEAEHGFVLSSEERRRRYTIQSLLWGEGLNCSAYTQRFGSEAFEDLPQLRELAPRGLATEAGSSLRLTPAGLERSDVLGPWLTSPRVSSLMAAYELR